MDRSSRYTVDNTELQIQILASLQNLKRSNKKCGTEEVFQLVLKSLESDMKNFLSKIKKWKQAVMHIKPVYEYQNRIK